MRYLCVDKFTAHVSHATQEGHILLIFKIVIYYVIIRLYSSTEFLEFCPRDSAFPTAALLEEVEAVRFGAVIKELPGIPLANLSIR